VKKHFHLGVSARTKEGESKSYNLVTDADIESERAITHHIRDAFPSHEVMGEEEQQADVSAEHLWIIDPLDGTNNFAHQIPHFAVSIAYYHCGVPQCGVIYNPVTDNLYTAIAGAGASADGGAVQVAPNTQLSEIVLGVGFYYDRGKMMEATLAAIKELFQKNIHGLRRFGAASLDLCHVAMGRFGAFFEYELAPWDFAAGRLFVTEAGGRVTDCLGNPLGCEMSSVLATNGHTHQAVLDVVRRHYPHPDITE